MVASEEAEVQHLTVGSLCTNGTAPAADRKVKGRLSGCGAQSTLAMRNQWKTIVMLLLVSSSSLVVESKEEEEESSWSSSSLPYIAAGAVMGAVAAPAALTAAGFTAAGIAAGSLGAGMMKLTALAYGGGVPAGSAVAMLQSAGATAGGAYVSAAVGGAAGYVYEKVTGKSEKKEKN
ncbi:uncharacterized protein LOC144823780 [Lissotriton helveticus]